MLNTVHRATLLVLLRGFRSVKVTWDNLELYGTLPQGDSPGVLACEYSFNMIYRPLRRFNDAVKLVPASRISPLIERRAELCQRRITKC